VLDIAHANHGDPARKCIVRAESGAHVCLAVVDGWGSWGNGAQAAAWVRDCLDAAWRRKLPTTAHSFADELAEALRALPPDLRDPEFGCGFSVAALVARDGEVGVCAAGLYGVDVVGAAGVLHLYRPRYLSDRLIEEQGVTPAELAEMAFADVYVGSLVEDAAGRPWALGLCTLGASDSIIIARRAVLEVVAREAGRAPSSAVELQGRIAREQGGDAPVVIFRPHAASEPARA
jgi:hypothetical protein